ncbi:C5a anaphylatoxin chemotactic receptor 1-like [Ambystoma mexicanum]|uniref:C5a anaphylatoxin chemotactic receptor 1-like n=1 Tax=Ambystoma mexicanum TaxID=8296 RepID=UPI0037E7AC49
MDPDYDDNYDDYFSYLNGSNSTYVNISTDDFHVAASAPSLGAVRVISLVIYSLTFLLGVPGNGVVIWMTGFEMKRTVNTVWFLNLAIADFLCCLVVPFSIMLPLLDYHWPLGGFACKVIPSVYLLNMYTSVLILTAISLDRCILVMKPIWCQNHRTVKKALAACLVVWLLSLLMTSPSFVFRKLSSHSSTNKTTCNTHYAMVSKDPAHAQKVETFIAVFRFLCGFCLPFMVITGCYCLLIVKVSHSRFNRSDRMLKMILVVIIGFFMCWFPYHVAGLILATNSHDTDLYKSTHAVDSLLISIAFINSCINPVVYVIMGQDFKEKFQKSIKSILRNVLTEDLSQSAGESRKTKSTSEDRRTDTVV